VRQENPRDSARVFIPRVGRQDVFDQHPSIAELEAPPSPDGGPWSKAKAFGNGVTGEQWSAWVAQSGNNPFSPPTAQGRAWKDVKITNLTTTTVTTSEKIVLLPEAPVVFYDLGVTGNLTVSYRLFEANNLITPWFERTFVFDGTESGNVVKDGVLWQPLFQTIDVLGFSARRGWQMTDVPFEIPYQLTLAPSESRNLSFVFESEIVANGPAQGSGRYGATTNSLQPVPEPSTYALGFAAVALGAIVRRWRRRN
jgi:hypothetical protein